MIINRKANPEDQTGTMIQAVMDFGVIVALLLVVPCVVEGCLVSPSPYLSLAFLIGQKTPVLQCLLCLDKKAFPQRNFTFTLTRNGKVARFNQMSARRIQYPLDHKKNHTGLWRCKVREFPDLREEYYLGPPVPSPPAEKKDAEETSVPPSAVSTRVLLTIATAGFLLTILILVTSVILGICIRKRCRRRKKSTSHPHHRDGARSDNFPLTENLGPDLNHSKLETDTEVSYVELEIIRDPSRKPSKSLNTIYANIM